MLNEEQSAVAEFAAELVKGLSYVDAQTTSRPSQTPPALKSNPKQFITNLVRQTRSVPSNAQQLKPVEQIKASVEQIPIPQINSIPDSITTPHSNHIIQSDIINQQPTSVAQLELNFSMDEKDLIIQNFKQINVTLTKILNFLNENCTKSRKKTNRPSSN